MKQTLCRPVTRYSRIESKSLTDTIFRSPGCQEEKTSRRNLPQSSPSRDQGRSFPVPSVSRQGMY